MLLDFGSSTVTLFWQDHSSFGETLSSTAVWARGPKCVCVNRQLCDVKFQCCWYKTCNVITYVFFNGRHLKFEAQPWRISFAPKPKTRGRARSWSTSDQVELSWVRLLDAGLPGTQYKKHHRAMGQHQWYHFGVGAPPILVYVSWNWDVHWGYRVLTHSHSS